MTSARAASALVIHTGRVLLVQRGTGASPTTWAPPGGHARAGESYATAAARELWEETGLHAVPVRLLQLAELGSGPSTFVLATVLMTLRPPVAPRAASDAAAVGWFEPTAARALPLAPGVRGLLLRFGLATR
jgi:8-oxo-dGTP diphosphatase